AACPMRRPVVPGSPYALPGPPPRPFVSSRQGRGTPPGEETAMRINTPEGERSADSGGVRRPRPSAQAGDPRAHLLRLQRSAGNRAVGHFLAAVQRDPGDGSDGSSGRSENMIPYEERMANNRRAMDVIASSDAPIVMSWSQRMFRRANAFGTMGSAPGLSSAEDRKSVV